MARCPALRSWEKEHISSEALEAARIAANKYMVKVSGGGILLRYPIFYFLHSQPLEGP